MERIFVLFSLLVISIALRLVIVSAIDALSKKYKCNKGQLKLEQQSLLNKVTRIYLLKVDIKKKYLLRGLVIVNIIYVFVLVSHIPWSALYLFDIGPQDILGKLMTIKHLVLDIPTFVFMILFTKRRNKHVRSYEWNF